MSDEFTLHLGDCLAGLVGVEAESVDAMVTDPPAGIGFMGKMWDKPGVLGVSGGLAMPSTTSTRNPSCRTCGGRKRAGDATKGCECSVPDWNDSEYRLRDRDAFIGFIERVMREAFRVLKPGAHGLVWALPRTSHWTATALEQAGFEVRDVIHHHFGTGFPKSLNVSKAIDQARTEDEGPIRAVCRFVRAKMDLCGIKSHQLTEFFGNCDPRLIDHWAARDTDSQPNLPTLEQWARLKEILELADDMDAEVARLNLRKGERGDTWKAAEVVGEHTGPTPGLDGQRFEVVDKTIREPSEAAKQWDGWGTGLKPATEHWILVRKPLGGTVAANVQEHGTGALNVDGCRIASGQDHAEKCASVVGLGSNRNGIDYGEWKGERQDSRSPLGRWPANLVLSHTEWCEDGACLPGCPVALLDAQSGSTRSSGGVTSAGKSWKEGWGFSGANPGQNAGGLGDAGGASRFFYVSKPTTEEREENVRDLPKRSAGELVDREAGSAGMSNPRAGAGRTSRGRANIHPTVKSVALMSWLVTLVTPPGGLVLDPFTGSGTTGVTALRLGHRFLGFEIDPDYHRIALAKLERARRGEQLELCA